MQKKVIALAVAGLISAGAYAQSNVQIYGIMDYGYSYRYDRADAKTMAAAATADKKNSRFDTGQSAGNRLGFKGVEDLGNGLKAVFVLERGFDFEDGTEYNGFNRQAYVGLAGGWGTLAGGLIYTPHYNLWSSVDPFGGTTIAKYQNLKQDIASSVVAGLIPVAANRPGNGGIFDPVRVKNTLAYISPNWGGFSFVAAYSNDAFGEDGATSNNNNIVGAVAANYTNGPLMIGLSYHMINPAAVPSVDEIQNFSLGLTYNFDFAKVAFAWGWDELAYKQATPALKDVDQNNFLLGATFPFGKHAVKASINYSLGADEYGDAWQFGLGYTYNLSKRTNFYAAYAIIDNDSANATGTQKGRFGVVGDASNGGGVYQQGFQLGIKHSF